MPRLLFRYLLGEIIPSFLLGLFIFSLVLFMDKIIRIVDWIVQKGVPVGDVIKMLTQKPPAIAGVSSGQALIMAVYPSIAATAIGKALGRLYESMPARICGIKLSHLLFPLPTAIIAITLYFYLKLAGEVYALTNRTLQLRISLGNRLKREIRVLTGP